MEHILETEALYAIVEETFDTCSSKREEYCWLISILRGIMNVPNHITEYNNDNMNINLWQYQLDPILEYHRKHYHHNTTRIKDKKFNG